MRKFIKSWLKNNEPHAQVYSDQSGIYITKGYAVTYPCIVAHIDEVHDERNSYYRVIKSGDYIFGYNTQNCKQYGIGADDKNGIWVSLQCLKRYDAVKVALFVGEEIGCVGSTDADMDFFKDCRFVLQCDRRGSSDFITAAGGEELCDEDFLKRIDIARYGYKEATGMMTDVMQLKENGLQVAAANISCGYYNPHQDTETTIFSELENCRDLVFHIIDNVTDVCAHEPKKTYYGYGYGNNLFGNSSYYYNGYRYGGGATFHETDVDDTPEDEIDAQYQDLVQMMYSERLYDPTGFSLVDFYDMWKSCYPALDYNDFRDALDDLLFEELQEDDDDEVVIG